MSVVKRLSEGGGQTLNALDAIFDAAERIGCDASVLEAIINVECGGDAFDRIGRLIILPEKHIFHRLLPKSLKRKALLAGLAATKWSRKNYRGLGSKGSDARWNLLVRMAKLHEEAALKSASYGAPQIMGFNHEICGYSDVTSFVEAFAENNINQIEAFIRFLERSGLSQDLRERDFEAIARRYNGPGQVKRYASMMRREYKRLTNGEASPTSRSGMLRLGSEGYRVKALQQRLSELGYTLRPDGDFGPATRRAVVSFQVDHGLAADGVVGPVTEKALDQGVALNAQAGSSRENLTVKDLRKNGSQTVKNADRLTRIGQVLTGTGAAALGLEETDAGFLNGLGEVSEAVTSLRTQVEPLLSLISENRWLAFFVIGLAVVAIAHRIKQRRLEDAKTWRHLG